MAMKRTLIFHPLNDAAPDSGLVVTCLPSTIGRGSDCDVRIERERISRHHARLARMDEQLLLEDLGSTNGTFVNRERIATPTPVSAGDLVHFADHGYRLLASAAKRQPDNAANRAGHTVPDQTVVGFTEGPTGFPVQAPQFYELLNDELIEPLGCPIRDGNGRLVAVRLLARSGHEQLEAGHDELQRLASQLGEESRLNELMRQQSLAAADQALLDEPLLLLGVHPVELEDADMLLDSLARLASHHRRLALGCEIAAPPGEDLTFKHLSRRLDRLGIPLAITVAGSGEADHYRAFSSVADYLVIDDAGTDSPLNEALAALGKDCRLIVAGVDDAARHEALKSIGGLLLTGAAIGPPEPLDRLL